MSNSSPSAPQIMYYGGGWPTNIGNAVIDLGAMALLQTAVPDAKVVFASEMPRWFFGTKHADNALDVASICRCDLAVFSGMAMCKEFVSVNGPTILRLRRRGIPVLLLGTGGRTYAADERKLFSEFLSDVKPCAVMTRDHASYEAYSNIVERCEAGIDCGFFVSIAYQPACVDFPPYVVFNFDSTMPPQIATDGRQVIYSHHDCWGPIEDLRKEMPNTLISDIPHDYLTIYANAECVYSDRVHACVAALSYGRKAQLFHATPRGSLFDAVGARDIRKEPVGLDHNSLNAKRMAQIDVVAAVVRDCLKKG